MVKPADNDGGGVPKGTVIGHEGPESFKELGKDCYALGERVKGEAVASARRLKDGLPGAGGGANDTGGMFGQVKVARDGLMPLLVKTVTQLEGDAAAAEQRLYDLLGKVMTVSGKYEDVETNNKTNVAKALADLDAAAQAKPASPA